jgi:hypothetical protein
VEEDKAVKFQIHPLGQGLWEELEVLAALEDNIDVMEMEEDIQLAQLPSRGDMVRTLHLELGVVRDFTVAVLLILMKQVFQRQDMELEAEEGG